MANATRVSPATVHLLLETLRIRGTITPEEASARWRSVPTDGMLSLLLFEGAALWLHKRFRQLGVTEPAGLQGALRDRTRLAVVDHMRIDAQTEAVLSRLDGAGLRWALIKGQARRAAADRYPFALARTSVDVDLLVPEAEADRAWQLLVDHGFRPLVEGPVDWTADHHRPTLIDANQVAVELHVTTAMRVPPTEAWRRATEGADLVSWNGRTVPVPCATELVWQSLAHLVADGPRGFTLRAFLAIAAVLAADAEIDWVLIANRIDSGEVQYNEDVRTAPRERLLECLAISADLAGVPVPSSLRPRVTPSLVPLLHWRSVVRQRVGSRAVRERLLEEALRVEAGLPLTPAVRGTSIVRQLRRRGASAVARAWYRSWRAWQPPVREPA
jgi:hypothetical protein